MQSYSVSESFGDRVVVILPSDIKAYALKLKTEGYEFLLDICGVDYPQRVKRFEVVYHFFSLVKKERLRVKIQVAEGEAVESLAPVWKNANWFEREAWDMFGIKFEGHPHLERLLTHHEFKGHPLRKDYPADYQQHLSQSLPISFPDGEPVGKGRMVPLNIGPSHPATHGTLRIMAELDGEKVNRANVEIGYLHRCFEKMAETHAYNQVIPYTDRLNYCSAPINNVAYCKAVEKLLDVEIPPKAQALRVMLSELSRIIDHIVCIGAASVDIGALTGFFHLFSYRELVYNLFEKLCGARLTVALTRVGGMAQEPPAGWYKEVLKVCDQIEEGVKELDDLLTGNKIFISRTSGIASISKESAMEWGYTGPLLRATGVEHDLRKTQPYYIYDQLDFDIPVGTTGDLYDRYLVRVEEMRQSLKIIRQVARNIPEGDYTIRDKSIVLPEKKDVYGNIEGLMNHFMLVINGLKPPKGEVYSAVEGANGELGFYLVSDGSGKPYRLKVRPPCFSIYQSFPEQITGVQVADVVAILGSMNVIAGELDR
ncbi:MAG: NADH dehydrogenase (quinone) subunit D [Bdellovibrionales bacterium]